MHRTHEPREQCYSPPVFDNRRRTRRSEMFRGYGRRARCRISHLAHNLRNQGVETECTSDEKSQIFRQVAKSSRKGSRMRGATQLYVNFNEPIEFHASCVIRDFHTLRTLRVCHDEPLQGAFVSGEPGRMFFLFLQAAHKRMNPIIRRNANYTPHAHASAGKYSPIFALGSGDAVWNGWESIAANLRSPPSCPYDNHPRKSSLATFGESKSAST